MSAPNLATPSSVRFMQPLRSSLSSRGAIACVHKGSLLHGASAGIYTFTSKCDPAYGAGLQLLPGRDTPWTAKSHDSIFYTFGMLEPDCD